MMKKRLTALVLMFSLLFLLSACDSTVNAPVPSEEEPLSTETPTISHRAEFALACNDARSLDPLATTDSSNLALAGLIYEGLFELDSSFEPQPLLCEEFSCNETATVWTFTLRSNVVFSDGTPLTPKHVADSLRTARSSELYAQRLSSVIGVSTGEGTITVTLASPNGALPALLDIPITLPVEDAPAPLGTGPYRCDSTGVNWILRQNTLWWQEKELPLREIPLRSVTTAEDRIAAFDTALITAVTADPTSTNALGYSGSYEMWTAATSSMLYLGFRHTSGFCADAVLRQAISRAIDRDFLSSTLFAGQAEPSVLPVSPASPLYDANLADELTTSLSVAQQLLEDGGYKLEDGGRLTRRSKLVELKLLVNSENPFRLSAANYLVEALDKLGITVTVTALPWEEFLTALSAGQFDLYLGQVKMTADFDPTVLLTGALNYGSFWSEETNALLAAYRAATGDARTGAASALYANLISALPFAPLCFLRTSVYTQWGSVSGVQPTQQNPFHRFDLWVIS